MSTHLPSLTRHATWHTYMKAINNQLKTYPIYNEKYSDIDTTDLSNKSVESSPLILRKCYSVAKVEVADSPVGEDEGEWYRYVLVRGSSEITGYHRGTLKEATQYAHECIEQINERNRYNKTQSPNPKLK